jgi:chromosome partitioning protein
VRVTAYVHVIAVVMQKGGTGKTTTAVNLAAAFAERERRTLVVDLDPQAHATLALGVEVGERSAYDLLVGKANVADATVPTAWTGLDIVPTTRDLVGAELQLRGAEGAKRLAGRLTRAEGYDFCVIDCPPSLGVLTLNGLAAADSWLAPCQVSTFAMYGLRELRSTVDAVKKRVNAKLRCLGLLVTMYQASTLHSEDVVGLLRNSFGDDVFSTIVRRSVAFEYATAAKTPLIYHQPSHRGAEAYRALAQEVVTRAQDR